MSNNLSMVVISEEIIKVFAEPDTAKISDKNISKILKAEKERVALRPEHMRISWALCHRIVGTGAVRCYFGARVKGIIGISFYHCRKHFP